MKEIKFRLRIGDKIIGYEKWYNGHQKENDPCSSNPCWLYSKDNKYWNPTYIYHKDKDQYTGLKDKKGKEIYEGDVIDIKGTNCKIVYESCTASYHLVFKGGTSYQYERYKFDNPKSLNVLEFYETIGNIYQNPELLKEDKRI